MFDALIQRFTGFSSLEELVVWGGILLLAAIVFAETGLMVGFFLPGDSLLFTAGVLAAAGLFDIRVLILVLILAAIIGDQAGYLTGRYVGPRLFSKQESRWFNPRHVERTHAFYERYGAKTIILARFVPIVRTFAPIVAGIGNMNYGKFTTYNVAGGVLWVVLMCGAGYWLVRIVPGVGEYLHIVIAAIIVLSFLPILYEWWKARQHSERATRRP